MGIHLLSWRKPSAWELRTRELTQCFVVTWAAYTRNNKRTSPPPRKVTLPKARLSSSGQEVTLDSEGVVVATHETAWKPAKRSEKPAASPRNLCLGRDMSDGFGVTAATASPASPAFPRSIAAAGAGLQTWRPVSEEVQIAVREAFVDFTDKNYV